MSNKKRITVIEETCETLGLDFWEVIRKSGVPHSTVQNWRRYEPKTFQTYDQIMNTIEEMKTPAE